MTEIHVALDWTFNTNHLPFLIAQHKGFYKKAHLDVSFMTPDADNYRLTPAKKVEMGLADFALCPLESVISYRTKSSPFPLIAVAALFHEDLSAIACKKETAIRPAELDGKSYASYNARYEDAIVRKMLINDGGHGLLKIVYPDKLGIWETIENNSVASTWIFSNWEALEAENKGLDLNLFRMKDYNIPYSYSPVIATNEKSMRSKREEYRSFLNATRTGANYALDHPIEAAQIIEKYCAQYSRLDFKKSVDITNAATLKGDEWGTMELSGIHSFLNWLREYDLEHSKIESSDLFTNELLS